MNDLIRIFLQRIDDRLVLQAQAGERLDLYHIGRSALVLHYGFALSTQDFDIVEQHASPLEIKLIAEFKKGTPAARELGLYIDPVPAGVPPLPGGYRQRCTEVRGPWRVLRLWQLEVHDLAVTKLKSFRTNDRQDLRQLCDRGLIAKDKLRQALGEAYQFSLPGKDDADDPDRVKAFQHLERVEHYLDGMLPTL